MRLPAITPSLSSIVETIRRFPIPVLCNLLFTCGSIFAATSTDTPHQLYNYLFLLFCSCFGFIALTLLIERGETKKGTAYAVGLVAFILLYWRSYTLIISQEMACLAIASILLMFVAPYLRKPAENDQMWTFCFHLGDRIAFTVLAAIMLFAGLSLVIVTAGMLLLDKSGGGNIYWYLWLIIAGFFSPLMAMAGIPRDFNEREEVYPKFIKILLSNIVLPLWATYIVVLYLYIAKIILSQTIPNGQIAYLVSAFGIVTVGVYLKGYPVFKQTTSGLSRIFARYGFALLIAPLLMMAYSITKRISSYGVTEDRYLIVLCLVWLSSTIIIRYYDDAKAPRRILLSGIILLILASFGPWGMSAVSTKSQFERLVAVLEKTHVLVDGKIEKAGNISFEDVALISEGIDYFVETDRIYVFEPWFAGNATSPLLCSIICDHNDYEYKKDLKDRLGKSFSITYLDKWDRKNPERVRSHTKFYGFDSPSRFYDVKGYDAAIQMQLNNYDYCIIWPENASSDAAAVKLHIILNGVESSVCRDDHHNIDELIIDVNALFKTLKREGNHIEPSHTENLVVDASNEKNIVRLLINSLTASSDDDFKMRITSLSGILLVKKRHD